MVLAQPSRSAKQMQPTRATSEDAIMTIADDRPRLLLAGPPSTRMIADEFGLPCPGLRAATVSHNKLLQRAGGTSCLLS